MRSSDTKSALQQSLPADDEDDGHLPGIELLRLSSAGPSATVRPLSFGRPAEETENTIRRRMKAVRTVLRDSRGPSRSEVSSDLAQLLGGCQFVDGRPGSNRGWLFVSLRPAIGSVKENCRSRSAVIAQVSSRKWNAMKAI